MEYNNLLGTLLITLKIRNIGTSIISVSNAEVEQCYDVSKSLIRNVTLFVNIHPRGA